MSLKKKKICIIGGGPCGLYAAMQLLEKGHSVELFEYKANLGRKFLVAGHGGLNLTHGEDIENFIQKYYDNEKLFEKLFKEFSPTDYKNWLTSLGIEVFRGTSNRIFPKDKSAKEILKVWSEKLLSYENFKLNLNSKLVDLDKGGHFIISKDNQEITFSDHDHLILALGGASWPKTGSDANWVDIIKKHDINFIPFTPMNCGYSVEWSSYLSKADTHISLKNIVLKLGEHKVRGEALVTSYGIEGSGIYALNYHLKTNKNLEIDLKPDLTFDSVLEKLNSRSSKVSLTNHLRKSLSLDAKVFSLLREKLNSEQIIDMNLLAQTIKNFSITLLDPRPIEEAISSSGGIDLNEVNDDFSLKKIPKTIVLGEMLNWDAPTGGYLLQGCFSMSHYACLKL